MKKLIFKAERLLHWMMMSSQKERLLVKRLLNKFLNKGKVYNYVEIERYY